MADDLKVGDVVKLKSGSPKMTIESVGPQSQYHDVEGALCSWFDQKNQPQEKWFPLTSLEKA